MKLNFVFICFVSSKYFRDPNAFIILSDTYLIHLLSAVFCGNFKHKDVTNQEYPMSNIGMRKFEWMQFLMFNSRLDKFYFGNKTANINRFSIVKVINDFYVENNRFLMNNQIGN